VISWCGGCFWRLKSGVLLLGLCEMATEYPAFLVDLKDFIAGALKERVALHHGEIQAAVHHDEIEVISRDVVELVRQNHGGEPVYIPKAAEWERDQKHRDILKAFDGTNHRELVKRFGLGLSQIYRITKPKTAT
jgi:Mor family transcriptional regulator